MFFTPCFFYCSRLSWQKHFFRTKTKFFLSLRSFFSLQNLVTSGWHKCFFVTKKLLNFTGKKHLINQKPLPRKLFDTFRTGPDPLRAARPPIFLNTVDTNLGSRGQVWPYTSPPLFICFPVFRKITKFYILCFLQQNNVFLRVSQSWNCALNTDVGLLAPIWILLWRKF